MSLLITADEIKNFYKKLNMEKEELIVYFKNNGQGQDLELSNLPLRNGNYVVKLINDKGETVYPGFYMVSQDDLANLYQIFPGGKSLNIKTFNIKEKLQSDVLSKIKPQNINDLVAKFLLTRCPSMKSLFIDDFDTFIRKVAVEQELAKPEPANQEKDKEKTKDTKNEKKDKKKRNKKDKKPEQEKEQSKGLFTDASQTKLEEYKGKTLLCKGYVQSGKTQFIISASVWFVLNNKHSIIVLRNSDQDQAQIFSRISMFSKLLYSYVHQNAPELADKFHLSIRKNKKPRLSDFEGTPKIFLFLGNKTQLQALNETLDQVKDPQYTVLIDESDYVDSLDTYVKEELDTLKNRAYTTFGISATIMDNIAEETVTAKNLIVFDKPAGYYGLNSFIKHIIPRSNDGRESSYGTYKCDDMLEKDPYLDTFLTNFANNKLTKADNWSPEYKEWHPRDFLLRVTRTHDSNHRLLSTISMRYPKVVCMYYHSTGLTLYLPGEHVDSITLSNGSRSVFRKINYDSGDKGLVPGAYHCFKNATPGLVKEWLHVNRGIKQAPRILTLAGDMAARSISFGAANYEQCKQENRLWLHLTGMYALVADSTDQPELLQCLGRLCVVKSDTLPLHLYCTEKVGNDLIKAYNLQEELIFRAKEMIETAELGSINMAEVIQSMTIYKEKVPKRSITKKEHVFTNEYGEDIIFDLDTTTDQQDELDQGGWTMDMYVDLDPQTNEPLEPIFERLTIPDTESSDEETEYDDEHETIITKMYKIWSDSNNQTKISKFMKSIKPHKVYTQSEILTLSKSCNIPLSTVLQKDRSSDGKIHGYGKIIRKNTNNAYQLYPRLAKSYNRYFTK